MNYEDIKMRLQHALALLGDCEKNGVSALEYDLILNELREAYAAVRFGGEKTEATAEPHPEANDECHEVSPAPVIAIVAAAAEAEVQTEDAAEAEDSVDIAESDADTTTKSEDSVQRRRQFVRSLYAEMTAEPSEPVEPEQPEPQQEAEPRPETEEAAVAEPETAAENSEPEEEHTEDTVEAEPETEATESAEVTAEEGPTQTAPSDTESVEAEPEAEEQTAAAEPTENTAAPAEHDYTHESTEQVLGDVINADIKTFADTLAPAEEAVADIVGKEAINSLNEAIGINDRFLLMRDLFHGSPEELDKAVGKLDSFSTLDDCLVHIVENYDWNPHCDGAKLIMSLIERRYGHR